MRIAFQTRMFLLGLMVRGDPRAEFGNEPLVIDRLQPVVYAGALQGVVDRRDVLPKLLGSLPVEHHVVRAFQEREVLNVKEPFKHFRGAESGRRIR